MSKSLAKPLQPEAKLADEKDDKRFSLNSLEAVVNKYYESRGSKTPLLVERIDLLKYLAENI